MHERERSPSFHSALNAERSPGVEDIAGASTSILRIRAQPVSDDGSLVFSIAGISQRRSGLQYMGL